MCQHQTIYGRRCMDCLQRVDLHTKGVAAGRELVKAEARRYMVAYAHLIDGVVQTATINESYDRGLYYFLRERNQ